MSVTRWKVAEAFFIPKGMTGKKKDPIWPCNVVISCNSLGRLLFQYPVKRTRLDKIIPPAALSISSSTLGGGHLSSFIYLFSSLKSTQNLAFPSFFFTITTAKHHGDIDGRITPASSILDTSSLMMPLLLRDVLLTLLQMGS